jgi:hypothetical protein
MHSNYLGDPTAPPSTNHQAQRGYQNWTESTKQPEGRPFFGNFYLLALDGNWSPTHILIVRPEL